MRCLSNLDVLFLVIGILVFFRGVCGTTGSLAAYRFFRFLFIGTAVSLLEEESSIVLCVLDRGPCDLAVAVDAFDD